jgi:GNAT superfamily N-acetyltransferase
VREDPLPYRIEPLGDHDRAAFACGVEALDRYLKQQASQAHRRHIAKCFVAIHAGEETLGGFHTLSASSILFTDLPAGFAKRLPRYPQVPAALIGRLAVDRGHQGKGLGDFLLFDAMRRVLHTDTAATVVLVDAKDDAAVNFYRRHDFLEIGPGHKRLYLPVGTIAKIFA